MVETLVYIRVGVGEPIYFVCFKVINMDIFIVFSKLQNMEINRKVQGIIITLISYMICQRLNFVFQCITMQNVVD